MNIANILKNKKIKIPLIILGTFLVIFVLLGVFLGLPLKASYQKTMTLRSQANALKFALAQKDTNLIKSEIEKTSTALADFKKSYSSLGWLKVVPKVKDYYKDGERLILSGEEGVEVAKIFVEAVEPYSDFLGFNGADEEEKNAEKTTEDRIDFLVESVQGLGPKLGEIESHLSIIQENIAQIDPNRYPEEYKGIKARETIKEMQTALTQGLSLVANGKPLIERADWLLGKDEPRKYLFLFQNDAELRPTGGFWTAYGILSVDNGKILPLVSEDIYALDTRLGNTVEAPRPITTYHKNVYYWHLRDMNLSPDFKVSVEQFLTYYEKLSPAKIDGIIALDTNVLVDILKVLGRVGVPGWGNFESNPDDRCWGCPQVVYQLEMLADKPTYEIKADRKGFLAPLMHSIIANMFGSPKENIAPLASAIWTNIETKHLLTYFFDEDLQKGSEGIGAAGRIKDFEGDYFHFNDANFGGAKSNLFISQKIKHEYTIGKDGSITKKVTINYKNSAPGSDCNLERGNLCLNGLYRDWFRLFVPKGSELISLVGSEVDSVTYEELGKTVFEGFFGDKFPLRPEGIAKVAYEYKLPFKAENSLDLLIQKQPGKDAVLHEIWINGQNTHQVSVDSDTVLNLSF